jgi:uncharacterized membrane protein YeiH
VLTREVYAAAAFCGGAAYCATWACSQDAQLAILAALCSTGALHPLRHPTLCWTDAYP